jgi:hypothetical protein
MPPRGQPAGWRTKQRGLFRGAETISRSAGIAGRPGRLAERPESQNGANQRLAEDEGPGDAGINTASRLTDLENAHVAERIVRTAPCPVLTVREGPVPAAEPTAARAV